MRKVLTGVMAGFLMAPLYAASQVSVVGLFPGAAVVNVDGQRKLVREGQQGPGGVVVVRVDKDGALLRVEGVERMYPLGREYSGAYSEPVKRRVTVARGPAGHFWLQGSVNGFAVTFMLDTGATSVVFNAEQAKRLGLNYARDDQRIQVSTANGVVSAWRVKLAQLKIGELELVDVDGVVMTGESPAQALLGMSFLNRVSWREEQGVLVLESKL